MSKHEHKVNLREVRQRLQALSQRPRSFDQLVMAERVEVARVLCDNAYHLIERRTDRPVEKELWMQAAALFQQSIEEAYPPGFWDDFDLLSKRDPAGLDTAITFLEIDPWFFRSGYIKADLLRFICRRTLSPTDLLRLQQVVLAAIDFRDRREFRWYSKLAKFVQSTELRTQVEERLLRQDPGVRRRARWVLSGLTHNKTFHIRRGLKQLKLGDFRSAIGDFNRAILLEPGSVKAFLLRGKTLCPAEKFSSSSRLPFSSDFARLALGLLSCSFTDASICMESRI
jgi:hypothetical protein